MSRNLSWVRSWRREAMSQSARDSVYGHRAHAILLGQMSLAGPLLDALSDRTDFCGLKSTVLLGRFQRARRMRPQFSANDATYARHFDAVVFRQLRHCHFTGGVARSHLLHLLFSEFCRMRFPFLPSDDRPRATSVSPQEAADHPDGGAGRNAILSAKRGRTDRRICGVGFAQRLHLFVAQFSRVVSSTPREFVSRVVSPASRSQVQWSDTRRVIAGMKDQLIEIWLRLSIKLLQLSGVSISSGSRKYT